MFWSDKPQNEREQRLFDAGFPINNTYGTDRYSRCGHCHKMFKGAGVWGPDFALDSDPPEATLEEDYAFDTPTVQKGVDPEFFMDGR